MTRLKPFPIISLILSARSTVLLLVLLSILVGCSWIEDRSEPEFADRSFISGEPCEPPCWYGLIPGKSTKPEVISVLKELAFVDQKSITEYQASDEREIVYFSCQKPNIDDCGGLIFQQEILESIYLSPHYRLNFESVVQKLGDPLFVDYGGYHPEIGGCIVNLEWPDRGIAINFTDTKQDNICQIIQLQNVLPPDIVVNTVYYSIPGSVVSNPGPGATRIEFPGFGE